MIRRDASESLLERARRSRDAEPPRCALAGGGKGYVVKPVGAVAVAELALEVKTCPACFGRARMTVGNESRPCRRPSPNQIVSAFNEAEIPARYADAEVESFRNFTGNGAQVVAHVRQWLEAFKPVGGKGLILTGPVGVGKTYMLAAIARYFCERGLSVRFCDFFSLLADLRAAFSEGQADLSVLAPLIEVDVLIIDELGKGRGRDFDRATLDQLVSERYKCNRTIVASTNYKLKSVAGAHAYNIDLESDRARSDFEPEVFGPLEARVGQRVFSRLREMTNFVELTGDDFRRTGAYL